MQPNRKKVNVQVAKSKIVSEKCFPFSLCVYRNQICLGCLNGKKSLLHKDNALSLACFLSLSLGLCVCFFF